jgi:hypothetical protein
MHKYLKTALFSLVFFFAGFYSCILIRKYSVLKIDPTVSFEINPFEIFTLLATIILAIYVAKTIAKANELEKGEKEILIKYLTDFKTEFGAKINSMLDQPDFDNVLTNSNFKILRKRIDTIIGLAVDSKFINANDSHSSELQSKIRDVWELFTNTPRRASERSSASVRNDIKNLRLDQVSKINIAVIEIEKLLFQLIMKIHKK